MTTVNDLYQFLNKNAPYSYQEDYDNSGLIVGNWGAIVKGVLISLDCTEAIVEEAIANDCNVIISHHPIVFKGLKRFTGANYVERTVIKAIKAEINIIAIHTNIDNTILGVNNKIADKLELKHRKILSPKPSTLKKLTTFVPVDYLLEVKNALHAAGAGHIGNYSNCAFLVEGQGTFTPNENSNPFSGKKGETSSEKETRIEVIFESHQQNKVIKALFQHHPYEEVAHYIHSLDNDNQGVGAGMVGELEEAIPSLEFFNRIKHQMNIQFLRHTKIIKEKVQKIAICGGSGSFLTQKAISSGADVFVSADYKYHDFFDADGQIIIVDIGHYESEKFTIDLLFDLISNNFSNFALHCTKVSTNPVYYY